MPGFVVIVREYLIVYKTRVVYGSSGCLTQVFDTISCSSLQIHKFYL